MKKIKTGDQVIVISGKDKGKQGSVTKILSNGRCYVSGVQMVKRHTKPCLLYTSPSPRDDT